MSDERLASDPFGRSERTIIRPNPGGRVGSAAPAAAGSAAALRPPQPAAAASRPPSAATNWALDAAAAGRNARRSRSERAPRRSSCAARS